MRRPPARTTCARGPAAASLALALVLAVAGCTGSDETDRATRTAEALAAGLSSGKLGAVRFADRPTPAVQRWWDDTVGGMDVAPKVEVTGVEPVEDDATTATLSYTWPLGGEHTWTYDTSVRLSRAQDGEAWVAELVPAAVEPSLAEGEVLAARREPAERGDILGAGGAPLVTERPVLRFGIDKTRVRPAQQAESARRLARLLDITPGDFVSSVEQAGDRAFVEALVLREGDVTDRIRNGYPEIPGAIAVSDDLPLAPTREFARPILGTVGAVTAEIVEESDGRYQAGDEAGLSGLQLRYDQQLAGTPGVTVEAVGQDDQRRTLFEVRPKAGKPLRTTLDPQRQRTAERLLGDVGPASALVAVRPSDGHILAAASGPGSDGQSTATVGQYAPGSTFKVVTSLALLRAGLTPDSTLPCTDTVTVDGKPFKNYDDYPPGAIGDISLRSALANSCNTAFISQRGKASQDDLAAAAASLGLGVDHDLGFPAYFGQVGADDTETGHAAAMIGQGKVLASPLVMAAVAASVQQGSTVTPVLLPAYQPDDGGADAGAEVRQLAGQESDRLASMMRSVVTEGSATFLGGVPGAPVLAKTGTAEFGEQDPPQTHAWMIAAQGDLAVAVFVDVGESGSQTAGPILSAFLRG